MHLSPAAFGQRIATLERQLGEQLLTRSTRRVALTEFGERALTPARRVLDECARFRKEVLSPQVAASYELTIGTRFELGMSWLTPALTALAKLRPERTLHLSFGDSRDMLERLTRLQVDASVTSSQQLAAGTQHVTLHREDYVFVACAALLRTHGLNTPEDAARHVLLDIDPDLPLLRYFLDGQESSALWSFRHIEYLGTIAAIRHRVLEGHGVAVLPHYFIAADLQEERLIPVQTQAVLRSDSFRLVWLADHARQAELILLGDDLRSMPLH